MGMGIGKVMVAVVVVCLLSGRAASSAAQQDAYGIYPAA